MSLLYPVAGLTAGGIMVWSAVKGVSVIDTVLGVAQPKTPSNPADSFLGGIGSGGGGGSAGTGTPSGGTSFRQMLPSNASLGRTDMGVDVTMPVGSPIRAPAPSRLAGVINGWFAGQPLVWYEITSGPDKGKFYYAAEQFSPATTQVGATFNTGAVIGHYAASGTAMEVGWATASGQTLSQAHGTYTFDGKVTPEGLDFRKRLGG